MPYKPENNINDVKKLGKVYVFGFIIIILCMFIIFEITNYFKKKKQDDENKNVLKNHITAPKIFCPKCKCNVNETLMSYDQAGTMCFCKNKITNEEHIC